MAQGGFPVTGGEDVVVGNINNNIAILVRKSLDENAPASTITVQDDDELFFTVDANSIYFIRGWFCYSAVSNTPDLRVNYSYPAGATFKRADYGPPNTSTTQSDTTDFGVATTSDNGRGAGTVERAMMMEGELITGGTAGTFRVRFGQVTTSVDLVTMKSGSRLMAWKYS
jgi:hypothetical protein